MAWLALSLSPDQCGGACLYVPAVRAGCPGVLHAGWLLQCRLIWPCHELLWLAGSQVQLGQTTLEHLSYLGPFTDLVGGPGSFTAAKRAGLAEVCTPGVELPRGGHPERYK